MRHEREYIDDWLVKYDGQPVVRWKMLPRSTAAVRTCIHLKGCNGSGKSTIPMQLLRLSKNREYFAARPNTTKPCGVYCPELNLAIVGIYPEGTNCGGCDAVGDTQSVKTILAALWRRDCHIMFEGVIVGDIKSTFYELMKAFNAVNRRELSICFMGTPLKECLRRIQERNGGKPINETLVEQKYRNSLGHLKYYLDQGDIDVKVLNTSGTKVEVLRKFCELYPLEGEWSRS